MKISNEQYALSLFEALEGVATKDDISAAIKRFIIILDRQGALKRTAGIIAQFGNIWDKNNQQVTAEIDSARPLDKVSKEVIINYLRSKVVMKNINLQENIRPELIGGFVLRYESRILDASLKKGLESLHHKISN